MKTNTNRTKIERFVILKAKELRIKNGLTQADLAFKMDVTTGFIGKIEGENSVTKYNLNHINKLAEIFNVSPKEFLPETNI